MIERVYTEKEHQNEIQLKLLENNQSHVFKTMERIESHHRWLLGSIFGLYAVILAAILAMVPFVVQVSNLLKVQ